MTHPSRCWCMISVALIRPCCLSEALRSRVLTGRACRKIISGLFNIRPQFLASRRSLRRYHRLPENKSNYRPNNFAVGAMPMPQRIFAVRIGGELQSIWFPQCASFLASLCGPAHFARGNLSESRYDFPIVGYKKRLCSFQELLCSFRRQDHELESTGNFLETIFDCDTCHKYFLHWGYKNIRSLLADVNPANDKSAPVRPSRWLIPSFWNCRRSELPLPGF